MSINLGGVYSVTTNAAIAQYDAETKLAYQGSSRLAPRVRVKTGVTGQTHFFRRMGSAVATQHTTAELITPADYTHSKIAATLSNWRIGDYTDLFDQAETNIDERQLLGMSNGKALGRAEDQLVIDALDAASGIAGTVDEDLGGTNSLINSTKLIRAKRYLMAQQADGGDHTIVVNAAGLEGALSQTQVTSADYQTFRALVDANLQGKMAFGFVVVMEDAQRVVFQLARRAFARASVRRNAVGLARVRARQYVGGSASARFAGGVEETRGHRRADVVEVQKRASKGRAVLALASLLQINF
jgi:hypothetical protein